MTFKKFVSVLKKHQKEFEKTKGGLRAYSYLNGKKLTGDYNCFCPITFVYALQFGGCPYSIYEAKEAAGYLNLQDDFDGLDASEAINDIIEAADHSKSFKVFMKKLDNLWEDEKQARKDNIANALS